MNINDPFSAFKSQTKGFGKIIQPDQVKKKTELSVHIQVTRWLKWQYPNLVFRTDFAAGIKMSASMASRHAQMQSCSGFPDLFILEPKNGMHGLFIELKKEVKSQKDSIYKIDGSLKKNEHIENQSTVHDILRSKGYAVYFAAGFDEAKELILNYLKL